MPKLGRRQENTELDYQWNTPIITKNAPFGTLDTPSVRTKIIGGKRVTVYEDNKVSPRRPDQGPPVQPWDATHKDPGSFAGRKSGTPLKLAPLTEKPNQFNPQPFLQKPLPYSKPQTDNLSIQRLSPEIRSDFSPHTIVPPIDGSPEANQMKPHLVRHLPVQGYLPKQAILLDKGEELELRQRVYDDLTTFDSKKLRDVYLELSGYDRHLTGFVNYTDLGLVLMRFQVNISAENLRLVASLFIDERREPGMVQYEKILSFISSSLKPIDNERERVRLDRARNPLPPPADTSSDAAFYNPITLQNQEQQPKRSNSVRDNSKLLRLIEQQLLESSEDVDFENVWQVFRAADRQHRGKMAKDQIKSLAYGCRIPLQESLMNQVIDRCDTSNGQYDWQQFLGFLEKVQPAHTGLKIPESKRPVEYAKHYPQATNNWPMDNERMTQKTPSRMTNSPRRPFSYLETEDPDSVLGFNHPQYGRTKDEPPVVRKPQLPLKETQQDLDNELDKLRKSYEVAKQKVLDEKVQKMRKEDWFDRYMKLAQALYDLDDSGTGNLPSDRVAWAVERFNDAYMLELPMNLIPDLLDKHLISGKVNVDAFLKSLGAQVL